MAWQRLADCQVPEALQAARSVIAASAGQADLQIAYACELLSAADQLNEARSALEDSIAELTRAGHMPALCYSLRTRATIELRQGRMLQALKTAGEALALAQEGKASWPGWTIAQVAAVEATFGLQERCREHVLRAEQSCGGDDRWAAAEAQAALGCWSWAPARTGRRSAPWTRPTACCARCGIPALSGMPRTASRRSCDSAT